MRDTFTWICEINIRIFLPSSFVTPMVFRVTGGLIDGQTDRERNGGRTDGGTDGGTDGRIFGQIDRWTDGFSDRRTVRWIFRQTDGRTDRRKMDGRIFQWVIVYRQCIYPTDSSYLTKSYVTSHFVYKYTSWF